MEKEDLRKYNNNELKIVWRQVILAHKKGKAYKEIKEFLGLSIRKICEICRSYSQYN